MDPNSGKVWTLEQLGMTEAELEKDGRLVPVPPHEEKAVLAMNRHARRAWAAKQRRTKQ